jgi:hypothetical protein
MRSPRSLGRAPINSGKRIAVIVPFAQEHAVGTETLGYEARVLNQDALQANDFLE